MPQPRRSWATCEEPAVSPRVRSSVRRLLEQLFARRFGLDAVGFRAAVRDLRQAGFRIEVRPGGTFRLAAAPDGLEADQIAHRLGTRTVGCRVQVYAETPSTNDLAWDACGEYRTLWVTLAEDEKSGYLAAIYRHFGDYVKVSSA